jgi:hypothetical protein
MEKVTTFCSYNGIPVLIVEKWRRGVCGIFLILLNLKFRHADATFFHQMGGRFGIRASPKHHSITASNQLHMFHRIHQFLRCDAGTPTKQIIAVFQRFMPKGFRFRGRAPQNPQVNTGKEQQWQD